MTVVFPQKVQTYFACCVISIFLTCFRREAPYLYSRKSTVSYFPLYPRRKLPSFTAAMGVAMRYILRKPLLKYSPTAQRCRLSGSGKLITYLVPYLPVTPTFLVRFVILADGAVMNEEVEDVLSLILQFSRLANLSWCALTQPKLTTN